MKNFRQLIDELNRKWDETNRQTQQKREEIEAWHKAEVQKIQKEFEKQIADL